MRLTQRKLLSVVVGISIAAVASTYAVLSQLTGSTPTQQPLVSSEKLQHTKVAVGVPVKIKIPVLNINAKIDLLGVTPAGDMEAPKAPPDTGWYKLGTRPGDIGSAVIAGHYGNLKGGERSVFDNLAVLKKGDKVIVTDEVGKANSFTVQTTRVIGKDQDAQSVFTSSDNKSHLNLVTCHGTWQQKNKTYSERLVIFTDLDTDKI